VTLFSSEVEEISKKTEEFEMSKFLGKNRAKKEDEGVLIFI